MGVPSGDRELADASTGSAVMRAITASSPARRSAAMSRCLNVVSACRSGSQVGSISCRCQRSRLKRREGEYVGSCCGHRRGGDHLLGSFRNDRQKVSDVVDAASLPRGSDHDLADRRAQPDIRVRDHRRTPDSPRSHSERRNPDRTFRLRNRQYRHRGLHGCPQR